MLFYLGIILVTFILYILRFHNDLIHAYYLALKINGPRAYPIIGSGLLFLNKSPTDNFKYGYEMLKEYGSFFKVWLGLELDIVVSDPNDVEMLLNSSRHIDKSTVYDYIKPWLNEGLLLSTGKKWHDRRKVITPAFHFNILEKFVEVFDRLGNTVIEKLNEVPPNADIEFYPIAVLYALDVMCETAMGVSIDALTKPNQEYVQSVKKIASVLLIRMFDFILRYPLFYNFSKLAKEESDALRVLHGFTDSVIRKRRKELLAYNMNGTKTDENDNENLDIGIRKKRAFLDLLLQSSIEGKPLTDLEIREEVDTFMFEGHNTTTSGITFCLYNIAKHPEVQQKCFKEIVEVFGTDAKEPSTLSKLNQLSYLELVVKESLRLFPSVPIIGRMAMEDIELTNKRIIPKGANALIPIYAMSRDERYFDNPDEFQPERFLEERSMDKKNLFTYLPFSAGPRNCIGQKFAMYEIKCIISKILHHFEIGLTDNSKEMPELCAELILRPDSSINFYFKRRV